MKIISINNFPTAAGLASSASGYAALSTCIAYLNDIPLNNNNEQLISEIARHGSGSASRSIHGGFVKWIKNKNK